MVVPLAVELLKALVHGVGEALEQLFLVTLSNFCFYKAVQLLSVKHQLSSTCSQMDKYVDRTTFCKMLDRNNQTNPCCPGELPNVKF